MSLPKSVYKRLPKRMPHSLGFSRYALDFDGVDDYVDCGNIQNLGQKFTASLWSYRLGSTESYGNLFGIDKDTWNSVGGFLIWDWNDGTISVRLRNGSAGVATSLALETNVPDNEWRHYTIKWDKPTLTLYRNGVEINNTTWNYDIGWNTFHTEIGIGLLNSHFYGLINNVRVYDRALPESEIRRNMLNYHTPTENGLVGWWRFEEGDGLTAYDKSGGGNDGTLNPSGDPPTWVEQKKWEMRAEAGL